MPVELGWVAQGGANQKVQEQPLALQSCPGVVFFKGKCKYRVFSLEALLPAGPRARAVTLGSDGRLVGECGQEAARQKTQRHGGAEEGDMAHASQSGMSQLSWR